MPFFTFVTRSFVTLVKPRNTWKNRSIEALVSTRRAEPEQSSSTLLFGMSRLPGAIAGFASLQSAGREEPSASRSRLTVSAPEQSSSTPLSGTSAAPGRIPALPSLQSAGTSEPSPSRSKFSPIDRP